MSHTRRTSKDSLQEAGWISLLERPADAILADPDLDDLQPVIQISSVLDHEESVAHQVDSLTGLMSPVVMPSPLRQCVSSPLDPPCPIISQDSWTEMASLLIAEAHNCYFPMTWEDIVQSIHAIILCSARIQGEWQQKIRPSWLAGYHSLQQSSLPISQSKRTRMIYSPMQVSHVLGSMSSKQMIERMSHSVRKILKDEETVKSFWRSSMLEWSDKTPHVVHVEHQGKAIELIESSAVCTSLGVDRRDCISSEWLHIESERDDSKDLFAQCQETCDLLSLMYERVKMRTSGLVGFPSVGDRGGYESMVRLECGDRMIRLRDNREWNKLVDRVVETYRSNARDWLVTRDLILASLDKFESSWPRFEYKNLSCEWAKLSIETDQVDLLVDLDKKVKDAVAKSSNKNRVWPFVVTRRCPVVLWCQGSRVHMMIRCKQSWNAKQSVASIPRWIRFSNQDDIHARLEQVSTKIERFFSKILRGECDRTWRVMDLWDVSACMTETMVLWRRLMGDSLDGCLASCLGDFCIDARRILE